MRVILWILLIATSLVTVAACAPLATPAQDAAPLATPAQDAAGSDVERNIKPEVKAGDLEELVQGNSAFAFDLYQVLKDEQDGNLFYSPYSISMALAMTYAGARSETERQMAEALQFSLSQERLHPAFNGLDLVLSSRGEGAEGKDEGGFRLNIANALWAQQGYEFLQSFLDTLAENYDSGLQWVDFENAPEEARVTINDWISEQTEGRIEDLIPAGAIDSLTRLVLTNAIYFNAGWQFPFDKARTEEGPFTRLDGSQVTVPRMHQSESLGYAEGQGYQAVDLSYSGGELSMTILLPQAGNFEAFEASLDAGRLEEILEQLSPQQVALTLPQFEFESQFMLPGALRELGMEDAFTEAADFSGMTGNRDLSISDVIHKAFVSVDEQGTEAAAATAVIMKLTSMPAEPVEMTVDRPFIFTIRDIETGTILFIGRVMDPSA
jgi:serpin B